MSTKILFLLLCFIAIISGCENKNDDNNTDFQICTEEFVYGLSITLKDVNTNTIITEGLIVTAIDGTYQETLMTVESIDSFFGAGERPGTYIITVNSIDYQPFTSEPVAVLMTADGCHVITQALEFFLQPI